MHAIHWRASGLQQSLLITGFRGSWASSIDVVLEFFDARQHVIKRRNIGENHPRHRFIIATQAVAHLWRWRQHEGPGLGKLKAKLSHYRRTALCGAQSLQPDRDPRSIRQPPRSARACERETRSRLILFVTCGRRLRWQLHMIRKGEHFMPASTVNIFRPERAFGEMSLTSARAIAVTWMAMRLSTSKGRADIGSTRSRTMDLQAQAVALLQSTLCGKRSLRDTRLRDLVASAASR